MRTRKRFTPAIESLESREVPTAVLIGLLGEGVDPLPSFNGSGYALSTRPLGSYLVCSGYNFLTPTITVAHGSLLGYGSHADIMAGYLALQEQDMGVVPRIVPLITSDAGGYHSDAVGQAELWLAQMQGILNARGEDVRWVALLPSDVGFAGVLEQQGRAALAAANIPLIQSAGNDSWNVSQMGWLYSPYANSVVVAAANPYGTLEPYSNYGSITTTATTLDQFGTSGAAVTATVYAALDLTYHGSWPASWVTYNLRHDRGLLWAR